MITTIQHKPKFRKFTPPPPAPKNQKEDGTAFLPSNPSCHARPDQAPIRLSQLADGGKGATPQKIASQSDTIIIQDFRRKRFELQSKNSAISQKAQNRPKSHHRKPQVEGGAEFPPETPLPPRPLHCWIFLGFLSQMQRAREAKKRGRGRGQEEFSLSVTFFIANTNHSHRSCSKRPTSASIEYVTHPTHISERLPRFPPLLTATEGRVRHTDMC